MLGISLKNEYKMNFLAVKIKPGEPYGTLITDQTGKTYNIEYNVSQNILKSLGEVKLDEEGYQVYPGQVNCFLISL